MEQVKRMTMAADEHVALFDVPSDLVQVGRSARHALMQRCRPLQLLGSRRQPAGAVSQVQVHLCGSQLRALSAGTPCAAGWWWATTAAPGWLQVAQVPH